MEDCVVCFLPTASRVRPCDHVLCDCCAEQWFSKALTCPYCRAVPCGIASGRYSHPSPTQKYVAVRADFARRELRCTNGITVRFRSPRSPGGLLRMKVLRGKGKKMQTIRRCSLVCAVNGIRTAQLSTLLLVCQAASTNMADISFEVLPARLYERWLF